MVAAALVAARLLQGLGASALMSVNGALLRLIYPARLRGRGFGTNALVVAMNYSNQLLRKWMEFRKAVRPCLGSVPGRDWVYTGFRTVPNSIRRAPIQYRAARYGHNLCIGEFVPAKPS